MATWDEEELATQVLKELGVVGSGQTASAEDTARVTAVYPSIYEALANRGLASWESDEIEEEAQLPLAKYVAGKVASSFGFTGQRLAELRGEGQQGWLELQEAAAADRQLIPPKFKDY